MQIQVVCCHPLPESYDHALFRAVVGTLEQNGHRVVATDLYREGFHPAMTAAERRSYMDNGYDHSAVASYVDILTKVDGVVLCFPHGWFSMPAMLKGWVDRVWGPGIAFTYDADDGHLRPNLMRGMKPLCAKDVRSFYLAHYGMDASTPASRHAFLEKVRRRIDLI
jgi:putative NADPH-quinone reductase